VLHIDDDDDDDDENDDRLTVSTLEQGLFPVLPATILLRTVKIANPG
jgi:hypothetical protein